MTLVMGLFVAACDKGGESKRLTPRPPGVDGQLVETDPLSQDYMPFSGFPVTPEEPQRLDRTPDLTKVEASELIRIFESASGASWAASLKEMGRRKSPECLRSMAENITLAKSVSVVSGEYVYTPLHNFPVAMALLQSGNEARPALIDAAKNLSLDQKSRVLNVLILMGLNTSESASLDWFDLNPNLESAHQALKEIIDISSDKNRLAALFPQELPQN